MAVDARLVERARRPGLAPLWDELARRFASSPRPVSSVTLRGLADAERRALADLLARPRLPDATTSVRLDHVAAAFGIGAEHLRPLVEALRGPLGDRAADRRRDRDDRAALWRWLEEEAARRGIEEWARRVRSLGVPGGDVGAHRERLQAVLAVIDAVAALDRTRPPVPLAVLANDVLGDPHALDPGAALTGPVVDAVAALAGVEVPTAAEGVRLLWAQVGVATDELSPTVLVLGLDRVISSAAGPIAGLVEAGGGERVPLAITLDSVRRSEVCAGRGAEVFVVENPSLVALAASEGVDAALVCTSGWPNVAVLTLLRALSTSGAHLLCHADFDPAGVLIVRHLITRVGGEPWAMGGRDYLAAVARSRVRFDGSVADTPWDPALAEAMRHHRAVVFEEDVREELLGCGLRET